MKRALILRGAAVLTFAALAACDVPTTLPEKPFEPVARRTAAPVLTVSDSGGYPLISWAPLAAATSYTVVLRSFSRTYNRITLDLTAQFSDQVLGSTTGSSFLDTAHAYTGSSSCSGYVSYPYVTQGTSYLYQVTATFADGTSAASITPAPVGC